MAKNTWLFTTLITFGLISLAVAYYLSSQTEDQKPFSKPLARAELNLGKAYLLKQSMTKKDVLTKRSPIFRLESLETSSDGDVSLEFDSGYRMRVSENTLITFDTENESTTLILKRGDIIVENFGREGAVFISKDGEKWEATEYETVFKKQPQMDSLPEVSSEDKTTPIAEKPKHGLTSDYIESVLKGSRNSFLKCYTQVLQKTPGITGEASITFTIEKNGKVSTSELSACNINDADFKKCLIGAIRRVKFASFDGDPITTVFPIKFE